MHCDIEHKIMNNGVMAVGSRVFAVPKEESAMPYVILMVEAVIALVMWLPTDAPTHDPGVFGEQVGMFNDDASLDVTQVGDRRGEIGSMAYATMWKIEREK